MTLLRVNVGGLDFFGHRGPYAIGKDGFTGWDDQDYRADIVARPNAHGNYGSPSYREAKTVNLSGHIVAAGAAPLNQLIDRFNGILAEGGTEQITVQRPWGARWAPSACIVSRKAMEVGGLNRGTFALVLRLDDPQRFGESYAPSTTADAPLDVFHRGNADAWPVIMVTGSMPGGYELMIDGRLLEVLSPLVSGQPHVINTRTRRITVGGSRTYGAFGISEPLHIVPGLVQNFYALPKTSGSATFKVAYYDTYI